MAVLKASVSPLHEKSFAITRPAVDENPKIFVQLLPGTCVPTLATSFAHIAFGFMLFLLTFPGAAIDSKLLEPEE